MIKNERNIGSILNKIESKIKKKNLFPLNNYNFYKNILLLSTKNNQI